MAIHKLLDSTRALEAQAVRTIDKTKRPVFHLTGSTGWINDPNGFCLYGDEVHLFYQANPYSKRNKSMHWSHAKTRDFVHWTWLPTALAPEEPYDKNGCFSGTALTLPDGRHLLMYTGVEGNQEAPEKCRQTQCLAIGDGLNYEKYSANPVIDAQSLPAQCSRIDFRDPKIWQENGVFYCLVVNRLESEGGAVLLFESPDALHWKYAGMTMRSEGAFGSMLECPDLFTLDGEDFLLLSVQEMGPRVHMQEGYITMAIAGDYDRASGRFYGKDVQMLDEGIDFYAAQTVLMPDGRRVMIAWMQNWSTIYEAPEETDFNGQMTVPRELFLKDGRICTWPVREISGLYGKRTAYINVVVREKARLAGICGRTADLSLRIRQHEEGCSHFMVCVAENESYATQIDVNLVDSVVTVDRRKSREVAGSMDVRSFDICDLGQEIRLRILLDRYSMELFFGEGESAASFLLYTPQEADGISFLSDGCVLMDIEHYEIKP